MVYIVMICVAALPAMTWLFIRHQRKLQTRAFLLNEAVRNGDYSFRIPASGLFFGERALHNSLNDMVNDIGRLTAKNEVESWQRLTRVLTHEIMNATAPISGICQAYLSDNSLAGSPYAEGIRAINDATKSLSAFAASYRQMACLQEPRLRTIWLNDFFKDLTSLYPQLAWTVDIPESESAEMDSDMLRQVMMNITKNGIEAGATIMDVRYDKQHKSKHGAIMVSNNGAPIPAELAHDIFVPFFSTKQSGTGVGLPLSRQMLIAQGYDMLLASKPMAGFHVTFVIS